MATLQKDLRPAICLACFQAVPDGECRCGGRSCGCEACVQGLAPGAEYPGHFGDGGQARRAWMAMACTGGDETAASAHAVELDEKPSAPVASGLPSRIEEPATFRAMIRLCGLSPADAVKHFGQSDSSIRKKVAGTLPYTNRDFVALRAYWSRIVDGDLDDDMEPGSVEASHALRAFRQA